MQLKNLSFSVYDCFTEERSGGNVGVIVWNADSLNENQMQKFASEFKAPVTGYVTSIQKNIISARFFMPKSEISMCGHVTIGIFTDLVKNENYFSNKYKLIVPAGEVSVNVNKKKSKNPLVMFSLNVPIPINVDVDLKLLCKALNINIDDINPLTPIEASNAGLKHIFINMINEKKVVSISPNFNDLKNICTKLNVHTVACFSLNNFNDINVIKIRDFCPSLGTNEAAASGTTNGALAGYLLRNNLIQQNSQRITSFQGHEIGRPSKIITEINVDNGIITKLEVGGYAVPSLFRNLSTL